MARFSRIAKAEAAKYQHQIHKDSRHKYNFNCGVGKGGFEPGNDCASGKSGSKKVTQETADYVGEPVHKQIKKGNLSGMQENYDSHPSEVQEAIKNEITSEDFDSVIGEFTELFEKHGDSSLQDMINHLEKGDFISAGTSYKDAQNFVSRKLGRRFNNLIFDLPDVLFENYNDAIYKHYDEGTSYSKDGKKRTFASDCGAGSQGNKGFQPGNTCGGDGDGKDDAGDQGGGDKHVSQEAFDLLEMAEEAGVLTDDDYTKYEEMFHDGDFEKMITELEDMIGEDPLAAEDAAAEREQKQAEELDLIEDPLAAEDEEAEALAEEDYLADLTPAELEEVLGPGESDYPLAELDAKVEEAQKKHTDQFNELMAEASNQQVSEDIIERISDWEEEYTTQMGMVEPDNFDSMMSDRDAKYQELKNLLGPGEAKPENQESERPKYGVDTSVWEVLDDLDPYGVYGGKKTLQQSLGSSLFEYANPDGSISPDDVQNVLDDARMTLALQIPPAFQPPGLNDKMQELLKLYTEMHPG